MMPWFRLYPEILKDPKIRRFSTVQKWLWITAMCEASQSSERGKLFIAEGIEYTDDDLAQAAGLPSDERDQATGFIDYCVTLKMMERHADGGVTLLNFITRQYEKPSDSPEKTRERKRKQRAKDAEQKNAQSPENVGPSASTGNAHKGHAEVTPESHEDTPFHAIYTDTDSETDTETDSKEKQLPLPEVVVVGGRPLHVFKSVLDQYTHYFALDPSKSIRDLLHSYLDDGVQMDMIAWAMRHTTEKGKAWDYAKGTINNLFTRGIRTAEQAEIAEQEFKQRREQKPSGKVVQMVDKLPASVQWQLEQQKAGHFDTPQVKRTVQDVPEAMELMNKLRNRRQQAGS